MEVIRLQKFFLTTYVRHILLSIFLGSVYLVHVMDITSSVEHLSMIQYQWRKQRKHTEKISMLPSQTLDTISYLLCHLTIRTIQKNYGMTSRKVLHVQRLLGHSKRCSRTRSLIRRCTTHS